MSKRKVSKAEADVFAEDVAKMEAWKEPQVQVKTFNQVVVVENDNGRVRAWWKFW